MRGLLSASVTKTQSIYAYQLLRGLVDAKTYRYDSARTLHRFFQETKTTVTVIIDLYQNDLYKKKNSTFYQYTVDFRSSSRLWKYEERRWTRCNNQMFIINFCFNMFRASLCPSSGQQRTRYCIWCTALVLLDVVGSSCGVLRCRMWAVLIGK